MITDTIYAQVIMDCGTINDNEEEKSVAIVPFIKAQVFASDGTSKVVYCNYAFGKWDNDEIDWNSYLGKLKMIQLSALRSDNIAVDVGVICPVMLRGRHNLTPDILDVLRKVKPYERVLFVWDKAMSGDKPFYDALNIDLNDANTIAPPIMLADEGLTLDPESMFFKVKFE